MLFCRSASNSDGCHSWCIFRQHPQLRRVSFNSGHLEARHSVNCVVVIVTVALFYVVPLKLIDEKFNWVGLLLVVIDGMVQSLLFPSFL